jgi:prenylcysteine oxidase/farnesylcysteine lyase
MPRTVLTTETEVFFSSIGLQGELDVDGRGLYKVFSRVPLSDLLLTRLFEKGFIKERDYPWKAYPRFSPPEEFSDFVMDEGLVYVNSIESAASAMEVGAIGGRNAALLLQSQLKLQKRRSNTLTHQEL